MDFNVNEDTIDEGEGEPDEPDDHVKKSFNVQMFGNDETGATYSIQVQGYFPFFYVLVPTLWRNKLSTVSKFCESLGKKNGIVNTKLVDKEKLYGYYAGKKHLFLKLQFSHMQAYQNAKNQWYNFDRTLKPEGVRFDNQSIMLYETAIPPLLRFLHIRDLNPAGWVTITATRAYNASAVNCTYVLNAMYSDIIPLNDKETRVPYKIMSTDIEASSSHGDFPIPVKNYLKLAMNLVDISIDLPFTNELLKTYVLSAFSHYTGKAKDMGKDTARDMGKVEPVFVKQAYIPKINEDSLLAMCEYWLSIPINKLTESDEYIIMRYFEQEYKEKGINDKKGVNEKGGNNDDLDESDESDNSDDSDESDNECTRETVKVENGVIQLIQTIAKKMDKTSKTILHVFSNTVLTRDEKIHAVCASLDASFPPLEGDKCTFIGSTFMKYGDNAPYFNHCIALNTCVLPANATNDSTTIEWVETEQEVLLSWTRLMQRENPDIIIGYNLFGFDYEFLYQRAKQLDILEPFLKLSRNANQVCATKNRNTGEYEIAKQTIVLASGQHDLKYILMGGRVQIDLYNYYRREVNLSSYKLDSVAGHFIGDSIYSFVTNEETNETTITTKNMTGLTEGNYIHVEELGNSVNLANSGEKFLVLSINRVTRVFVVRGILKSELPTHLRWCLAKDDVSPKDIFRLTNGSAEDRGIVAKYCIQDCNLVHYLLNKSDVLTGFIEMARICSVPLSFLIMRGQGIKLTSFVAKKCREKQTLMPTIEKGNAEDAYEGAIVLEPKTEIYIDTPIPCVDFAGLYPSCMISENLCLKSKVWTKAYDLAGNLLKEEGEKKKEGEKKGECEFLYDNLPGVEYVTREYDTYKWVRNVNKPNVKPTKVHTGSKICRFAQDPNAIMPSILKELLKARKDTRKLIPQQTDDFIKGVLEQRQLGYKVTANSLYGQCGAKTSTFYEQDIAACTTSMGRTLLTYAKRIIEECYANRVCDTLNHGKVRTRSEYIYGDTDSVFFTFNLTDLQGTPIVGKKALEITIELAQQAGHLASSFLKAPHDLEYEKTFMPFCLLAKKKYVGMMYELDVNKCKRKEMGNANKRRDNSPIVKDIYGGIIDIIMESQNILDTVSFLSEQLTRLLNGQCPMDKLVITKSIRSNYKNPKSIAHKVLADRIAEREPGNKPSSGDRIPFVFILVKDPKKKKQGEKIETPTFIREHNLKIDYAFYITNQIMNPVCQLFALILEKMVSNVKLAGIRRKQAAIKMEFAHDPQKMAKKIDEFRAKEIKQLLFDKFLIQASNAANGYTPISSIFAPIKKS